MKTFKAIAVGIFSICFILSFAVKAQPPSAEDFKKAIEGQLQKLKPTGFSQRTVLFVKVLPGAANGGYYPFKVWANIHDYGAGYPANGYYGQTCLGKMDGWKFDMRKDDFGEWVVQGRFTVSDTKECKDNPSEGTAAISLNTVAGSPIRKVNAITTASVKAAPTAKLYLGEYACYGSGGTLLAGMGFKLLPNGRYHDLDNQRSGNYKYNAKDASITFKDGFLGGQVGKNVKQTGFQLSNTIYAEPWR